MYSLSEPEALQILENLIVAVGPGVVEENSQRPPTVTSSISETQHGASTVRPAVYEPEQGPSNVTPPVSEPQAGP